MPARVGLRFEIYRDVKKEWRWRLKARNGKIIAHGEGYKRRVGLENALAIIKFEALDAEIITLK